MPPTTFGIFAGVVLRIAGIDSFRREAEEEVLSHFQTAPSSMGNTSSSVVPGYVVDSSITSIPGWKMFCNLLAGRHNVTHVRIFGFP